MKFPGSQHTPPHQDRRIQLRMLGFVGVIAMVMFAVQVWRIGSGKGGSSHPHYPLTVEEQGDSGDDAQRSSLFKDDQVRILPRNRPAVTAEADDAARETRQVLISPAWLENVQDNTLGIRRQESDAYYRILAQLRTVSARDFHAEADQDVLFVHLMSSPEKFRGRPVTITGELVDLYDYQERENDYGVTRLYNAWIVTPDSGNQPYRVVCQSIPPELLPGKPRRQSVRVTGCFFKKEAYETKGGQVRVAPTLLAGRMSLLESPTVATEVGQGVPWMVGVITVLGLAILATMTGFALSDSRQRRWSIRGEVSAVDAAMLARADRRLSISESLRRLENDEPLVEQIVVRESAHGHRSRAGLPEEFVDLPTPFPPTRVPKRWDGPQ